MPAFELSRRTVCLSLAGLAVPPSLAAAAPASPQLERTVPHGALRLPVIGMGSSNTFDVGQSPEERAPLREVLAALREGGGRVIDTSPMYGRAERVIGELLAESPSAPRPWLATKVWTRGRDEGARQIAESLRLLRADHLDLLQIHNLLDWRTHVPTIRALQESGKVRQAGITHYRADAHLELERVLAAERFDWVQFNYSLAEPQASQRLLPFCRDHGIAVMVNRPFADGTMFERTRGKPLPPWAAELGIASWGQYFLKWIVSHPAVTVVIPATAKARHMADNCAAGHAPLPDPKQRDRMAAYYAGL